MGIYHAGIAVVRCQEHPEREQIDGDMRAVLGVLGWFVKDGDPRARSKVYDATIAEWIDRSVSSVFRARKKLERMGLIERIGRKAGDRVEYSCSILIGTKEDQLAAQGLRQADVSPERPIRQADVGVTSPGRTGHVSVTDDPSFPPEPAKGGGGSPAARTPGAGAPATPPDGWTLLVATFGEIAEILPNLGPSEILKYADAIVREREPDDPDAYVLSCARKRARQTSTRKRREAALDEQAADAPIVLAERRAAGKGAGRRGTGASGPNDSGNATTTPEPTPEPRKPTAAEKRARHALEDAVMLRHYEREIDDRQAARELGVKTLSELLMIGNAAQQRRVAARQRSARPTSTESAG